MGIFVLTNARLFAGGCDFTSRNNKLELAFDYEVKKSTNFGSGGWEENMAGLASSALAGEGFWEAGDASKVDDQLWSNMGAVAGYTVCPDTADVAALCYLTKALQAKYQFGGQVGEIAPWQMALSGSWPMARGKVLNPPGTARTATGNGTAVELAAVGASEYLYATAHVLSVSGTSSPTITFKIQSDADNTFASPTDQITFSAATAIGGQISRVAGAITDTWYRASYTISGSSPSFLAVVAIGIK